MTPAPLSAPPSVSAGPCAPCGARRPPRVLVPTLLVAALWLGGCAADTATAAGGTAPGSSDQDIVITTMVTAAQEAERTRNFEAAAAYYERLLRAKPDDPAVVVALSKNLRYASSADNAVRLMAAEAGKHGNNADVTLEYGKALLAAGHEAEAIAKLEGAVALAPENWQAHSALGIALDATDNTDRAQQAYRRALVLDPDNPAVLNNLAMSQAQSGKLKEAVTTLERAASRARANVQIRQNLALLYGVLGQTEKARALLAMDLDPAEVETNLTFYRRFEGQP